MEAAGPLGTPLGLAQRKRASPRGEASMGQEDPLEKEMATHSSILAWEIPWIEELGRLQSMGSQRVGHDLVTKTTNNRAT